jgi:hypothetical protein
MIVAASVTPRAGPCPRIIDALSSVSIASFALAIGVLLVLPSTALGAGGMVAPSSRWSERLLVEAEEAFDRGDFQGATKKYRDAYYSLSTEERASYLGSMIVRGAVEAYERQLEQEQDTKKRRRLLLGQQELIEELLDAVGTREGAAEEVGQEELARLRGIGDAIDAELEGEQARPEEQPTPGVGAVVEPDVEGREPGVANAVPDPEPGQTANPDGVSRKWVGLGMVIGGCAALGTGIGVTLGGVGIWTNADQEVAKHGSMVGSEAVSDFLAQEHARATNYFIAGGAVAGIGLVTAIGGAVYFAVRRRGERTSAMRVGPWLGPGTGGIVLSRRF